MAKQVRISVIKLPLVLTAILVGFALILTVWASAQPAPQEAKIADIEATITILEQELSEDADANADALELLSSAKQALERTGVRSAELEAYQSISQNLEQLIEDIRTRQFSWESADDALLGDPSVTAMRSQIAFLVAERGTLSDSLTIVKDQASELEFRAQAIAEEVTFAGQALERLFESAKTDLDETITPFEHSERILHQAMVLEQQSAVSDLQLELDTIPARRELFGARVLFIEADIERHDRLIARLRDRLGASARGRAEIEIETASERIERIQAVYPDLAPYAAENLRLAETLKAVTQQNTELERKIAASQIRLVALDQSAETVEQVLQAGRLSEDTSALLKSVQQSVPNIQELTSEQFTVEEMSSEKRLQLILWQDQMRGLQNLTAGAEENPVVDDVLSVDDSVSEALNRTRESLLVSRRGLLSQLIEQTRSHVDLSSQYQLVLNQSERLSERLSNRLDRRLIWLRTSDRFNRSWIVQVTPGIAWLLSPSNWFGAIGVLYRQAIDHWPRSLAMLMILVALIGSREQQIRSLTKRRDNVGHVGRDDYSTTPLALIVTILLAVPVPLVLGFMGLLLSNGGDTPQSFSQSLGKTALLVSGLLMVLLAFKEMCRRDGLFAGHFNWTDDARHRLERNLGWFIPTQAGAISIFSVIFLSGEDELRYGIGIIAFVIAAIALAALTFQILRPSGGVISDLSLGPSASILFKMIFPIAALEPLLVGALPFFGFYEIAAVLQFKVFQSGALALSTAVLYGLVARMFMVGNRRLALKKAKAHRAKSEEHRSKEDGSEPVPLSSDWKPTDSELISDQVKSVFRLIAVTLFLVTLWGIWQPILPALGIAGDITLWTQSISQDGVSLNTPVTLIDLSVVLAILLIAIFAAKNVGGLLEVGLFEPFSFDPGTRYAFASITRYIIVAAAALYGLSSLGVNWSELQWVVAALGVGLGFGLQEIVANFVSGLIILFERPIRVGDVVTIGELRGTVNNIRIRATTITDFDGRQVILPNKTIITENVTNWTLDDAVTRLLLKVGVAYGSDVAKVQSIILSVVTEHPKVLARPAPSVFLMRHGDSALEFEVRLFVGDPATRLPTTHELNTAINKALTESGIVIPFPQTDVHISWPMSDLQKG